MITRDKIRIIDFGVSVHPANGKTVNLRAELQIQHDQAISIDAASYKPTREWIEEGMKDAVMNLVYLDVRIAASQIERLILRNLPGMDQAPLRNEILALLEPLIHAGEKPVDGSE